MTPSPLPGEEPTGRAGAWTVFRAFLRLGLTSFGGPVAHLGYFRDEFVARRRWLSEAEYAELIALCQFLPGPASSQVGMALGLQRAGLRGALAAWCGFTLPSALLMILLALGLQHGQGIPDGVLHGMKLVAVAVVAQAVWAMARMFCRDIPTGLLALAATGLVLLWPSAIAQILVIVAGGVAGLGLRETLAAPASGPGLNLVLSRRWGTTALLLLFVLLLGLPWLAQALESPGLRVFEAFYRAGALVFGGGHVVLPLLQAGVVAPGLVGTDEFLAGYGAAQAVPGPLFTFSAFLGAAMDYGPGGWSGGLLCLLAIFLPSWLLVIGVLPFWARVRRHAAMRAALAGVNAAVVGLLLAALYDPLWTTAVRGMGDVAAVLCAFAALLWLKLPSWLVVLAMGLAGWGLAAFAG